MTTYPRPLTLTFIQSQPVPPGKYFDQDGLYLRVRRSGTKYWEHRVRVNGVLRTKGVGPYPVVSLKEARSQARRNLLLVEEGKDPFPKRLTAPVPTVAELVPEVIEKHRGNWSNPKEASRWFDLFNNHVLPHIGNRLVCDVERRDVMAVLSPIWNEKHATAVKVRRCLGELLEHAVASGYLADNPVDRVLCAVLRRGKTKKDHFPAAPYAHVAAVLDAVDRSGAMAATKHSLRFQVLTAARLGEVREARWSDIDFDKRVWTVPAERMKTRVEHGVPLSPQAIAVVEQARALGGANDLVFPSLGGAMLSNATHSKLLHELGFAWVPHGFRSSFRDWCGETGVAREVAEMCLAHAVGDPVEASYARSKLLERRRPIMEDWANYLDDRARCHNNANAASTADSQSVLDP